MYYKCHKINPNRGSSYIDSPDSIKNKKVISINAVTFALSHEEIKKDPQIITKIKAFKNKNN